jgi:hypothetical protein
VAEQAGPEKSWQEAGDRIDALLAASAASGAAAQERAEELVRLVADLYGAGLERLLDLLHERGALTDEVAGALAGDGLVASLLLVHGLHPYPAQVRIERALAGLGAELVEITEDGVARVRTPGDHDGCSAPSAKLSEAVRDAIESAAPEITAVTIDEPAPAVIPVSALFARLTETRVSP